jgi:demethylmenaquinone methyltransferase/2-methoxy-6-polyprenyl-1,4-benzoquinol methylase
LKLSKRIDGNNESLKPNGVFVILETSVPDKTPYKQGYNFTAKHTSYYWLFSKDDVAYGYLSESAAAFPYGEAKQYFEKLGL